MNVLIPRGGGFKSLSRPLFSLNVDLSLRMRLRFDFAYGTGKTTHPQLVVFVCVENEMSYHRRDTDGHLSKSK